MTDELAKGWAVEVTVEYDSDWSKNRMWRHARGGHYTRKEAKAHREKLATALRHEMRRAGAVVRQDRVRVEIMVFKGDHRGDALNVLDLVCDGIEDALELNDKWYSAEVDWTWTRTIAPTMRVRVSQGPDLGSALCPSCGQILPRASFAKAKGGPMGRAWICRACTRDAKAAMRAKAESA